MREKLEQIKTLVNEILDSLDSRPVEPSSAEAQSSSGIDDWSDIRSLLDSDVWPQAVFSAQIADETSELDKEERAAGICDIMLPPLCGKRFLDFGCGEGHVAKYASKEASLSVGYDIKKASRSQLIWEENQGSLMLTTDFEKVKSMGPYDFVLLYDVVDHAADVDPTELLSMAREVLADDGRIYMRCHPWCGRHGGHAYRKINKAFVHVVLTDDELRSMGVEIEPNIRTKKPLATYGKFIIDAKLIQESEPEIENQEVEDFFKNTPAIRSRILKHWNTDRWEGDPPAFQMSQCFVDYILKKK